MGRAGFGLIGTGIWGETYARAYTDHSEVELVAVCDLDEARGREIAERYGAPKRHTSYVDLLEEEGVDAVSIVTPDFAHTEIAVAAAEAGKHILPEKPMATTVEDCERIADAVERAGVKFMVDFHNRWNPTTVKAKRAIEDGEIGDPEMIYYRLNDTIFVPTEMLSWAGRSSTLWFLGSHCIDTLQWLLDDEVVRVYSVSRERVLKGIGITTPDFYQTTLEFSRGAVVQLENGWILPNTTPNLIDLKCSIVGTRGALYIDGSHHRLLEKYTSDEGGYPDVLVCPDIHGRPVGFGVESIRAFADCVVHDREPLVGVHDGIEATRVITAAIESAAKGQPVDLAR